MSPHAESQFIDWLSKTVRPILENHLTTKLQKVVEIGGETPGPDHGLSIALQIDFPGKSIADNWADDNLPTILNSFMRQFGPNAAFFTTLLESFSFI